LPLQFCEGHVAPLWTESPFFFPGDESTLPERDTANIRFFCLCDYQPSRSEPVWPPLFPVVLLFPRFLASFPVMPWSRIPRRPRSRLGVFMLHFHFSVTVVVLRRPAGASFFSLCLLFAISLLKSLQKSLDQKESCRRDPPLFITSERFGRFVSSHSFFSWGFYVLRNIQSSPFGHPIGPMSRF